VNSPDILLQRGLQTALKEALADTPVVCLLGPRQCGKSTLVSTLAPERAYFDFDDDELANTALADPSGFVKSLPERVTLDEVQRVPEILRAIKVAVDTDRKPGRFILTGSANILLLPRASESLAGRMEILQLHPLTESEKERQPGRFLQTLLDGTFVPEVRPANTGNSQFLTRRLLAGGYPAAVSRGARRVRTWHQNYLTTLLERDVHEVAKVRDASQLELLLKQLALQSGSLLNRSSLGRDLSMDRDTVNHYMAVLERMFLLRLLPAWHPNRGKRLVKSPKPHLLDSGLAATLMGLDETDWNTRRQDFGHVLESFVIQQLVAQAGWTEPALQFFHYRDRDDVEVDCVISMGRKVWGVEVKTARSVNPGDFKGLRRLADQAGKDFQGGIVLYAGENVLEAGDERLLMVPLAKLWEL
jgi:predicted AAA+ superfamily ATPase